MSNARKTVFAAGAFSLVLSLVVYTAVARGSSTGWFDGYRCSCGHTVYIHLKGDGYFKYASGHGMPEHRDYNLRRQGDAWEVVALRAPDGFWSPTKEGDIVARLRIQDGALYESWSGTTNWTHHARVYVPFRIWFAKLLNL